MQLGMAMRAFWGPVPCEIIVQLYAYVLVLRLDVLLYFDILTP